MKSSTYRVFACCLAVASASCRPATGPSAPPPAPVIFPTVPAPLPAANPKLPPVPEVRGPVQISVTYPKPEQLLTVRDSNFIFGSVGTGDAALSINGVAVPVWPNGAFMGWLRVPPDNAPRYELLASNGAQKVRIVLPVRIPPAPDTTHRDKALGDTLQPVLSPDTLVPIPGNVYVKLGAPGSTVDDTDRVTIARPAPGNGQEYKWFLFPGTVVKVLGTQKVSGDDFVHIQLDSTQDAWVLRSELQAANISTAAPTGFVGDSLAPVRRIGALRVVPGSDWIDVVIPVTGPPPPYLVEETDRTISLLLYGVTGAPVVSTMAEPIDPYFNSISSATPEQSRVRYTINLNRAPYGYLALWQDSVVTFRVRRPPRIADAASPLRGLTITIDPGHPPAALTLYFWPQSIPLGMATQAALLAELGLRDNGTKFQNIAVARGTWMPSVLTEGAFVIMPDQEAAMRTPTSQEAYATAIVRGLESYFASLAASQKP